MPSACLSDITADSHSTLPVTLAQGELNITLKPFDFNQNLRVFTSMVYGGDVFSAHDFYFWIPVIGPYVGGALAGLLYKHTVEVRYMNYLS